MSSLLLPHPATIATVSNEFSEAETGQPMVDDLPIRLLLALDPGVTTGWCKGYLQGKRLKLEVGQTKFKLHQIYDALHILDPDDLIYEDFEYRNYSRSGLDLTPVKVIGVIELHLEYYTHTGIKGYRQKAATGKSYYNDDKLKQYGVYLKAVQHGRDATRHLMHHLTFGAGSQYGDIDSLTIEASVSDHICALAEGTLS